ncbi:MAG: calcium-binding protein, partial [Gammaproteobacteria bacterium]|nr:calcium-binding protein [Gammaproteobacteria bacterium]
IAAAISVFTATVAGDLLISHIRSSERAEAMERQRSDWSRTTGFLEAEIALSERVIDDETKITVSTSCGFSTGQFRLGLDLRRDLPAVIYAVRPFTTGWLPQNVLWRCGPGLNSDGSYNNTITLAPILDGLDGTGTGGGFTATASSDAKRANFTLALKGHSRITYTQQDSARTRINPLYARPNENSLCDAANLVRLEGRADVADTLVMNIAQVQLGEDVLICGRGFGTTAAGATGDLITGSDNANDILEGGDYGRATLNGLGGNDVLRGTLEADTLNGGTGDDVLVGRDGDDTLNGGSGKNSYLPGGGNDLVIGGSGLDIVFLRGDRASYNLGSCSKTSCSISGTDGADSLQNVEILIFNDARFDAPE